MIDCVLGCFFFDLDIPFVLAYPLPDDVLVLLGLFLILAIQVDVIVSVVVPKAPLA